jgi:purine-nucleoside phosphorylase
MNCLNLTLRTWGAVVRYMALASLTCAALSGCVCRRTDDRCGLLSEYYRFNTSTRQILPQDYVAYLRATRFTNGELDHLPPCAIILHCADVGSFLLSVGYATNQWTVLSTGTTDPNLLYVVRASSGSRFIVNGGLPGAGGISTQAAELSALGVKRIIHLGTAGFLGTLLAETNLIVSTGALKDGAAVMLSDATDGAIAKLAKPDPFLTQQITSVLERKGVSFQKANSYTLPIFYLQPSGLIAHLLSNSSRARAQYIEMEEAPFYQTCILMHTSAASIVVGSDRYTLVGGALKHDWLGDRDLPMKRAFTLAVAVLSES